MSLVNCLWLWDSSRESWRVKRTIMPLLQFLFIFICCMWLRILFNITEEPAQNGYILFLTRYWVFLRGNRPKTQAMHLKHSQRRECSYLHLHLGLKFNHPSHIYPKLKDWNKIRAWTLEPFRSKGSTVQEVLMLKPLTVNSQAPKLFHQSLPS